MNGDIYTDGENVNGGDALNASEMVELESSCDTKRLVDAGCEHFWASRGGDPHARIFNGRIMPKGKARADDRK